MLLHSVYIRTEALWHFHDFAIFTIDLKDKAIWHFEGNMSNINSVQIKWDLKVSNCDAM